jgi:hypothetical protein
MVKSTLVMSARPMPLQTHPHAQATVARNGKRLMVPSFWLKVTAPPVRTLYAAALKCG